MTETSVTIKVLGGLSDTIPNPTLSSLLSDAYLEAGAPDFGEEEFAIAREFLNAMPEKQRERVVKKRSQTEWNQRGRICRTSTEHLHCTLYACNEKTG